MLGLPLANAAPRTAPDYIKMIAEDLPKANPAPAPPYRHDVPVQDFLDPIQSLHDNLGGFGGCGGARKGGTRCGCGGLGGWGGGLSCGTNQNDGRIGGRRKKAADR